MLTPQGALLQDGMELSSDFAGPLAEIDFWRSRSLDLTNIRQQLDKPNVTQIVLVLEHAKSSYLAPFLSLRDLIQRVRMGSHAPPSSANLCHWTRGSW
jgi:Dynein heavy chain, N-terminal region 1